MSIKILQPGLFSTIQDRGRVGFAKFGIPKSGAMDLYSAKIANLLLGNSENEALMEITLIGPKLEFTEATQISITGLSASAKLNNDEIGLNKVFEIKKGDQLHIKQISQGARIYLAVKGGFEIEEKLGSKSMYAPITNSSKIEKGDEISYHPFNFSEEKKHAHIKFNNDYFNDELEVFAGPEFEQLSETMKANLLRKEFSISKNNSRMAYQLEEKLENNLQAILTQPVLPGTVQFTPSGNIIILMRDCQTTGGYPRIFQLTEESINKLAQKKQGDKLTFRLINL
ncbi:5-oxoprolinase subunit C family protein [Mesonia aquimarina]|uniref:5-oxoprolinase subunit C family protein n=1 Tax=Mesonia aquimarina TaxID=1504967 RepID=UPI000EF619ED|nr:biotin-dependent carboxyltransferase family protein [Mesonia aquimarina]